NSALGRDAALALAAAVESRSEHHVGRAIAEAARALPEAAAVEVEGFRAVVGRGVVARVRAIGATASSALSNATSLPLVVRPSLSRGHHERDAVGSARPEPVEGRADTCVGTSTAIGSCEAVRPERSDAASAAERSRRTTPTPPTTVDAQSIPILIGNRALLADHGVTLPSDADARARTLEERGETVAFLAVRGALAALFSVADIVRDEAPAAIARLRALGVRVAIVSGDTRATTSAVAAGLGVEAVAEATPVEKRAVVARMQDEGRRVLFVGDGINDAPALTQADVGAAMGRATDVTMESADAVLVRDDLQLVPDLVELSRRTYAVIRQNVFWAFFYNLVAIPLAMAGVLHPIVAAAAMAASSLFVVLNSLRLRGALG
ncbi:MAG TPA: HAD-IC family P-type ATPase, partial [Anaeromyxobacter sp.]|nr:HAD-IC family P-type ATPase [Anaeromyxobacter sp.]